MCGFLVVAEKQEAKYIIWNTGQTRFAQHELFTVANIISVVSSALLSFFGIPIFFFAPIIPISYLPNDWREKFYILKYLEKNVQSGNSQLKILMFMGIFLIFVVIEALLLFALYLFAQSFLR